MVTNNNTERIDALELEVAELRELVTKLVEQIATIKSAPAVITKVRNTDARNLSVEEIRNIFRLNAAGMTGYKISKTLGMNAPYVYNILNRKIYADVNISNLDEVETIERMSPEENRADMDRLIEEASE